MKKWVFCTLICALFSCGSSDSSSNNASDEEIIDTSEISLYFPPEGDYVYKTMEAKLTCDDRTETVHASLNSDMRVSVVNYSIFESGTTTYSVAGHSETLDCSEKTRHIDYSRSDSSLSWHQTIHEDCGYQSSRVITSRSFVEIDDGFARYETSLEKNSCTSTTIIHFMRR